MTEATEALKSPPESQNDESDGSTNIEANQDGGTSGEANNDVLVGTTNKDDTYCDSTCKDKSEPQTSTERGLFYTDEEGSNDTNDLFRFSDSDFHEKDGSSSTDVNESKHEDYHDKDDNTTIPREKTESTQNVFKNLNKDKNKDYEKTINYDNSSSSDEEANYVIPQIASNDGGETSKTNEAFAVSEEEEQELTSSDEETDNILSQIAATIYEEGESPKTKHLCKKEENYQSSSDDDITYIPTYEQNTFNDGGECSKTKNIDAGLGEGKNLSFDDEGANLASLRSSIQNKDERAGPSNEVQAQIKPPRNKAERKINYTVPFKKFKKF